MANALRERSRHAERPLPGSVMRERGREPGKKGKGAGLVLVGALGAAGFGLWELLKPHDGTPTPTPLPVPTPTPTDPWPAWWSSHAPGTGYREAVSLFWVLLGVPPSYAGDSTYPIGVYLNSTHCAGTALQTTGFRLVSDSHCGFFNRVNALAGGPQEPQTTDSCSACNAPSCVSTGVCSDTGQPGVGADGWMIAAAAIVLGRNVLVPYSWVPGSNCFCNTQTAWVNAVQKDLIDTAEFTQRINEMAAAPAPPWEPGGHPGPA